MARATLMKPDTESWRNPPETGAIPGAVSPLTAWVVIGLLVVLFAFAGIWMVLAQGLPLPPGAICLRG